HLGGCGRDRLAGRWRGDHEPDPHLPLLLWSVRARHGAHLQGGELSPAPGVRDHADAGAGERRATGDGAGCAEPLVVALDHDVRAERCRLQAHRPVDALEDQALQQRRAAPEIHRYHGAARRGPHEREAGMSEDWPLYEVFIRSRSGLEHKHVGSLHAADARMAIEHARDVYTRRQEGVSIWVLRSADIIASDPEEADALFEPARDKVYRHPTFYAIPEEVKNL